MPHPSTVKRCWVASIMCKDWNRSTWAVSTKPNVVYAKHYNWPMPKIWIVWHRVRWCCWAMSFSALEIQETVWIWWHRLCSWHPTYPTSMFNCGAAPFWRIYIECPKRCIAKPKRTTIMWHFHNDYWPTNTIAPNRRSMHCFWIGCRTINPPIFQNHHKWIMLWHRHRDRHSCQ